MKFANKTPKIAFEDLSKITPHVEQQPIIGVPKKMARAKQVNEFLRVVLKGELEKLSKFNSNQLRRTSDKSISRKNSFNIDKMNLKISENCNNKVQKSEIKGFSKHKHEILIKDRSSSCEKNKDNGSLSTKRSTSNTKKTSIDPTNINIDSPSFVKLYDEITDERSRLIHFIKQCKIIIETL